MRAFLAVPVRQPALDDVAGLGARLRAEVAEVRWTPVESAHVTVHFFGTISADDAARAVRAVEPALAQAAPLRLRLQGLGCFPSEPRARVLWMGVAGDVDALAALAGGCRAALAADGFAVEDRAWRPHCTLGRPRAAWPRRGRHRWAEVAADEPVTAWFVADRAHLYESVQQDGGVRHEPRVSIPFGGHGASGRG